MALIFSLAGRLAGRSALLTRFAGYLIARELRHLKGKPVERQLLLYQLPQTQLALVNDLSLADTVLRDSAGGFPKATLLELVLRPLIGAGVFGQPGGDGVKQMRRVFARALARIPEERVSSIACELTRNYMADWKRMAGLVPVPSELSRLTMDIVSQASFGTRFTASEGKRFVELFFAYHRRANPFLLLLGSQELQAQQALVQRMGLAAIGAEMRALIHQRFIQPLITHPVNPQQAPFAAALLEDPALGLTTGVDLADDPTRQTAMLDEIAVMLLAGHETTASVLSWLLFELANAPDEQETTAELIAALHAETLHPETLHPGEGSPAAIAVLKQLGALTQEALRLYPPIAFLLRESTEAVTFRERPLCAGSFVVVSPWTIQRHRGLWPEPDRFNPGRWLRTEPPVPSHARLAMIPFGFGPRACPGKRFAEIEMQVILKELLGNYRLARVRGRTPRPLGTLTSRPDHDFLLRLTPRSST